MTEPPPQPPHQPWMAHALCAQTGWGPDWWFAEPHQLDQTRTARYICRLCDVRQHCLNYAITNNEQHGIWAGLSPKRIAHLRKHRLNNEPNCPRCLGAIRRAEGALQHPQGRQRD